MPLADVHGYWRSYANFPRSGFVLAKTVRGSGPPDGRDTGEGACATQELASLIGPGKRSIEGSAIASSVLSLKFVS